MRVINTIIKKTQINQSSEKLFGILELLASSDKPLRLVDISNELDINSSTTLRFLNTMVKCGYVIQDPESLRYYLSYKLCTIANKVSRRTDLRDVLSPYLREISMSFGESVCLSVDQGMKVVYVDVVDGPDQMIQSMHRIGNVAPLHATAAGKIFLTEYTPSQLDNFINTVKLNKLTKNTITSKHILLEELEKITQQGYAIDDEECELGARCLSCPIYDYTGRIIASISVTGPTSRLTMSFITKRLESFKSACNEISLLLGSEKSNNK